MACLQKQKEIYNVVHAHGFHFLFRKINPTMDGPIDYHQSRLVYRAGRRTAERARRKRVVEWKSPSDSSHLVDVENLVQRVVNFVSGMST